MAQGVRAPLSKIKGLCFEPGISGTMIANAHPIRAHCAPCRRLLKSSLSLGSSRPALSRAVRQHTLSVPLVAYGAVHGMARPTAAALGASDGGPQSWSFHPLGPRSPDGILPDQPVDRGHRGNGRSHPAPVTAAGGALPPAVADPRRR